MSTTKPNTSDLRIHRTLNAPIALIWNAWADARHLRAWWGPDNFEVTSWEHDFRTGGAFAFTMAGPGGMTAGARGAYEIVEPTTRIIQRCHNEFNGQAMFDTVLTYAFTDNGDDTTDLQIDVDVLTDDFPAEALEGMKQGWHEQLDKLGRQLPARD